MAQLLVTEHHARRVTELLQAAHAMPPDPARTAALDVSAVAADLPDL